MNSKFIILTSPQYDDGKITNVNFLINGENISELLPHDMIAFPNNDRWKTEVIMTNGNKYKVLETVDEIWRQYRG